MSLSSSIESTDTDFSLIKNDALHLGSQPDGETRYSIDFRPHFARADGTLYLLTLRFRGVAHFSRLIHIHATRSRLATPLMIYLGLYMPRGTSQSGHFSRGRVIDFSPITRLSCPRRSIIAACVASILPSR